MTRFLLDTVRTYRTEDYPSGWEVLRIIHAKDYMVFYEAIHDMLAWLAREDIPHHLGWCEPVPIRSPLFSCTVGMEYRGYVVLHHEADAVLLRMAYPQLEAVGA